MLWVIGMKGNIDLTFFPTTQRYLPVTISSMMQTFQEERGWYCHC